MQMRHVPRVANDGAGLRVLQPICPSTNDLGDDVGSFPGGGELVDLLLLQPKYQVTDVECSYLQLLAVEVAQLLLVDSCARQRRIPSFICQVLSASSAS